MRGSSFCRSLALLCVALALLAACGGGKKKNTSGVATPAGGPTPTPQALLDDAIKNTEALKAFHFTLSHENGSTPIVQGIYMTKADGDFVKPDKFKVAVDGTLGDGGLAIKASAINVGDQVWINLLGKYQPLQNGVSASAILDPNNGVLKAVKGVRSPAYAASGSIGGTAMTVVSGTIDAGDLTALDQQAQAGKQVPGKVWIGTKDHRVYRLRLDGPLNDDEPANIARVIDLSKFDEPLDIQPPS